MTEKIDSETVQIEVSKELAEKVKLYGINASEAIAEAIGEFEEFRKPDEPAFNVSVYMLMSPNSEFEGAFKMSGLCFKAWKKDLIEVEYNPVFSESGSGKEVKALFKEISSMGWATTESLRAFANDILKICAVFEKLPMTRTLNGHVSWEKPRTEPKL